jgi:hypothetical protein
MALVTPARRSAIHLVNLGVLVIITIGLPAVASLRFGGLTLSSVDTRHQLVFWGAMASALANGFVARTLARTAREKRQCRDWAALYLALAGAEWLYHHGYLRFGWLKAWLLQLKP